MINKDSSGIVITGHKGKWYVISVINDIPLFLIEHETYGDTAACLIIDSKANVILEDVWNGIEDYNEYIENKDN